MAYDQINPNGRDKIPRSARSTEPAWVTTVALPPEAAPFDLQAAINAAGDGEPTVIELNSDIILNGYDIKIPQDKIIKLTSAGAEITHSIDANRLFGYSAFRPKRRSIWKTSSSPEALEPTAGPVYRFWRHACHEQQCRHNRQSGFRSRRRSTHPERRYILHERR